jgi:hypothetical protein
MRSNDFAPISTISDYIHWAALMVWFVVFFITSMISGMFENLWHNYFILFNILHWNTTTHSIKDLNLFGMYLCIDFIAVICITIKSHQSNQTCSTTWRTFICCKYSLILFLSVTCNACICIMYLGKEQFTQNIEIPQENKITF